MDERFVGKFYRSIVLTWAIAVTWALGLRQPWIAFSITLGVLLGTLTLASFHWVVRRAFVLDAVRPRRALVALAAVKYPALGVLLYFLVRWDSISLPAFAGGIALVHFAILAKVLGIRLVERRGERALRQSDALVDGREI